MTGLVNPSGEGSSPVRRPCRSALASLSPVIWTDLPLRSYFVVMASSAATVDASQMCEAERSMTMGSGHRRSRTGCDRSLLEAKKSSPVTR